MRNMDETGNAYLNPNFAVEVRVDGLIAMMSIDEKLAQLSGVWFSDLIKEGRVDEEHVVDTVPYGIGEVTRIGGSTGLHPEESARLFNQVQRAVMSRTRLGIPVLTLADGRAGLGNFRQGGFFEIGRAGNGGNEIWDQICAALIYILHLRPLAVHRLR